MSGNRHVVTNSTPIITDVTNTIREYLKPFNCEQTNELLHTNILLLNHIYIYMSSTDRSVLFYQNSSVWLDGLDSRSWDRNPVDSNANPRFCHEEASASEVNLNGYESQLLLLTYFRLTATESSIHTKSLAYTLMATHYIKTESGIK